MNEIADGVSYLTDVFVNVYAIGERDDWVLIDTGVPKTATMIRDNIEKRFGIGARPSAIVLTHGHFDHAGSALELAKMWDVPIYAHTLELPYLTGISAYPPADPTVGGPSSILARLTPPLKLDLTPHIHPLEEWQSPLREQWEILETPGHAPGHISLFRESDRTLIAGDAFTTLAMNDWPSLLEGPEVYAAPNAFNCDFDAVKSSMEKLAALKPRILACGHGVPMAGHDIADATRMVAEAYVPPSGRYEFEAAQTDESGVVAVPPKPFDWRKAIILSGLAFWLWSKRGKKNRA